MSTHSGTSDIYAFAAIIILLVIAYLINNLQVKFVAYIFIILLLIWRAIVYIKRAIVLHRSF